MAWTTSGELGWPAKPSVPLGVFVSDTSHAARWTRQPRETWGGLESQSSRTQLVNRWSIGLVWKTSGRIKPMQGGTAANCHQTIKPLMI